MKKVDMSTAINLLVITISSILISITNYDSLPILFTLIIIAEAYCFFYSIDIIIKRIREKKSLPQASEPAPNTEINEELDNWTLVSFIVISIAFIAISILKHSDMPAFSIVIMVIETAVILICAVELIKRRKNKTNN